MINFPAVFEDGHKEYQNKTEAINDAKIGWQLCETGRKLPYSFGHGMSLISNYIGKEVTQNNYHELWVTIKVKEDRIARGLTQVAYAELFDISTSTVKAWENGRREPATYFWFLITFPTTALRDAKSRR